MLLGQVDGAALAAFCLSAFGVFGLNRVLVRYTKLSQRKPFNCSVCVGFWAGAFLSPVFFDLCAWWQAPIYGLASAGSSWLMAKLVTGDS